MSLEYAYRKYLETTNLVRFIDSRVKNLKIKYEILSSLERFIIVNVQSPDAWQDNWNVLVPFLESREKFEEELSKYKVITYTDLLNNLPRLSKNLKLPQFKVLQPRKGNQFYTLVFGSFRKEISIARWEALRTRFEISMAPENVEYIALLEERLAASNEFISVETDERQVTSQTPLFMEDLLLIAALKYEAMLPRGQHWAIPLEEYKQFNPDIEAFASPFNSQIILLGTEGYYCSIIEEDILFGSIGDFFDQDFTNEFFDGVRVVINPPFIELLLKESAKVALIINEPIPCISKRNTDSALLNTDIPKRNTKEFVFYGPYWTDASFFRILESEFEYEVLEKGTYYYEDPNRNTIIEARFSSVRFYSEKF